MLGFTCIGAPQLRCSILVSLLIHAFPIFAFSFFFPFSPSFLSPFFLFFFFSPFLPPLPECRPGRIAPSAPSRYATATSTLILSVLIYVSKTILLTDTFFTYELFDITLCENNNINRVTEKLIIQSNVGDYMDNRTYYTHASSSVAKWSASHVQIRISRVWISTIMNLFLAVDQWRIEQALNGWRFWYKFPSYPQLRCWTWHHMQATARGWNPFCDPWCCCRVCDKTVAAEPSL